MTPSYPRLPSLVFWDGEPHSSYNFGNLHFYTSWVCTISCVNFFSICGFPVLFPWTLLRKLGRIWSNLCLKLISFFCGILSTWICTNYELIYTFCKCKLEALLFCVPFLQGEMTWNTRRITSFGGLWNCQHKTFIRVRRVHETSNPLWGGKQMGWWKEVTYPTAWMARYVICKV